ncbi:MAG: glycosyltransferase [Bacteroidota bacterium]
MSRKKILWLCSWYPGKTEPFNGDFVQRHARAAALYNDIYVIHVVGDASGKIKKTTKEINKVQGITEHIIYYKRSSSFWGKMKSHYQWLALCRQAIRRYVIENGKPDLVHVHVPVKSGIAALWFKSKYKIPYLVTEHWGIYNDVEIHNYKSKSVGFKRYTKKIFDKATRFISVSKYLAEGVNRLVLKKEYTVIPNTVDTTKFYYKEKQASTFRFIHVSNMVPLKNAEGILGGFRLLLEQNSNAILVMVGDTEIAIRHFAKGLGIPGNNISFKGEIPYQQVAVEMQQSDCLVLFSNIENSPCVIGEALCCGLPVITTNVGGITELVNENNSLLVNVKNEKILAEAMLEMTNKSALYNRKKIAEDAISKFSYPVIGKKLDEIYNEVLSITDKN